MYYTTEESQNFQDDLCHNILTGKVLPPNPVDIGKGDLTIEMVTDASIAYEGKRRGWFVRWGFGHAPPKHFVGFKPHGAAFASPTR